MHEFVSGEIYWLEVGYQDNPSESKTRPAIIVDIDDDELLILVAATSVPPHNTPKYFDRYKIPILNWRKAGLPKPTWAQGFRLLTLTKIDMQSAVKEEDYIGRMDEVDFNYLVNELERIHNS
jgi:mRNA interferase MazF